MDRRPLLAVGLALGGLIAVLLGVHQELLVARTPADPTIITGWGGDLNYQEHELIALSAAAVPVAVCATRFRRAGYLVQAAGAVVSFYALRAAAHWLADPSVYTGVSVAGGTSGEFVLGLEPYLLLAGGLLLVASGVLGAHPSVLARSRSAHAQLPA